MAEFSYPWGVDATDAAAADSRLYQTGWREILGSAIGDCVVLDRSNASPTAAPLYVTAGGTNTTLSVGVGSAVVQGFLYDNTAAKTIDVATIGTQPSAGQSRTDSVVLSLNPTATPASTRLSVQLKAGTPATTGSQVAPTLTKSPTGVWEVEIARVTRANGANVTQANITQLQPHPTTPIRSTNAPGNPTVGQQWFALDGSQWIWSGTAWKYNGGGGVPVVIGRVSGDQTYTSNSTGANATSAFVFDTNANPSVCSNRSTTARFYAETPGTFRFRVLHVCRNTSAIGSNNQLTVTLQVRLNSADSITVGTLINRNFLTINPGTNTPSAYASAVIDEPGLVMSAGDYLQVFTTWQSPTTNTGQQMVGTQSLASLTWVGP